jgi:hypothetical protein
MKGMIKMKRIKKYIHNKLIDSMLNDDDFIPIYTGDELLEVVYRKVEK